ncbi:MAG: hypothetical protein ACRD00_07600 [Thermoanaerobaculia bacterium]
MKKALALALLLSAAPLFATDADTAFDPKEKITLELQDAKIADLVTTLGALSNMPVYIDPDVSGSISIKLEDTPFEEVLKTINSKTGVFVRIENGKLVASRSAESLFAAATLPEAFRDARRIALSDYDKVKSATGPIFAVLRTGEQDLCFQLPFTQGELPTYSMQIGASADAPRLFLTQFAFEPVSRARYFVLEYGDQASALLVVSGGSGSLWSDFKLRLSEEPREGCGRATLVTPGRGVASMTGFEVRAIGRDGDSEVVMAPRLGFLSGQVFGMRTEMQDDKTGQHRQMVISGYVTRDGRSVAAVLTATAIWIDPRDGREYYFAQAPLISVLLYPLNDVARVGALPAGVATPRPLELWVVGAGVSAPSPARREPRDRQ